MKQNVLLLLGGVVAGAAVLVLITLVSGWINPANPYEQPAVVGSDSARGQADEFKKSLRANYNNFYNERQYEVSIQENRQLLEQAEASENLKDIAEARIALATKLGHVNQREAMEINLGTYENKDFSHYARHESLFHAAEFVNSFYNTPHMEDEALALFLANEQVMQLMRVDEPVDADDPYAVYQGVARIMEYVISETYQGYPHHLFVFANATMARSITLSYDEDVNDNVPDYERARIAFFKAKASAEEAIDRVIDAKGEIDLHLSSSLNVIMASGQFLVLHDDLEFRYVSEVFDLVLEYYTPYIDSPHSQVQVGLATLFLNFSLYQIENSGQNLPVAEQETMRENMDTYVYRLHPDDIVRRDGYARIIQNPDHRLHQSVLYLTNEVDPRMKEFMLEHFDYLSEEDFVLN